MKAWLVVNSFMNTDKFKHLYEMLSLAFNKRGVSLNIKTVSLFVTMNLLESLEAAQFSEPSKLQETDHNPPVKSEIEYFTAESGYCSVIFTVGAVFYLTDNFSVTMQLSGAWESVATTE